MERNEGEAVIATVLTPYPVSPAQPVVKLAAPLRNDVDLLSYRIGFVYKLVESASIYIAYGNSETPSQATVNGGCAATTVGAFSCNVDPEEAETYEIGAKWGDQAGPARRLWRDVSGRVHLHPPGDDDVAVLHAQFLDPPGHDLVPDRPGRSVALNVTNLTDLSATLFLSEPEDYEGGELVIEDTYGGHAVKLAAGDMILYPASSLHHVTPITEGARVACFFWVQSMVREDTRRTLLFDIDMAVQRLATQVGLGAPHRLDDRRLPQPATYVGRDLTAAAVYHISV